MHRFAAVFPLFFRPPALSINRPVSAPRLVGLKLLLFSLLLSAPALLQASTISGTVQDPSNAVISGARVEIAGGDLSQPILLSTDAVGKFVSPELKPGNYSVRITHQGFEPLAKTVILLESVELQLTLAIAEQKVQISVAGKSLAFANSDPVYRQLRELGLGQTFRFDNFTLAVDAGTFQFRKGTLAMLKPVNGVVTGAIFIGMGISTLSRSGPS